MVEHQSIKPGYSRTTVIAAFYFIRFFDVLKGKDKKKSQTGIHRVVHETEDRIDNSGEIMMTTDIIDFL